jgi:plastocyanin
MLASFSASSITSRLGTQVTWLVDDGKAHECRLDDDQAVVSGAAQRHHGEAEMRFILATEGTGPDEDQHLDL